MCMLLFPKINMFVTHDRIRTHRFTTRSSFVPEEPDELDDIADMWRWALTKTTGGRLTNVTLKLKGNGSGNLSLFMYFLWLDVSFFSEVCVEVFLRFLQVRYSWDIDHTVIEIYYTTQLATHPFSCWGQMYWLGWCETESCPFTKKNISLPQTLHGGGFIYVPTFIP